MSGVSRLLFVNAHLGNAATIGIATDTLRLHHPELRVGAIDWWASSPDVLSATTEDGLQWTLTLRPGLRFHDGTPVLARDCVASIRRWWVNDAFGQALAAATDELAAADDKTIRFRLKRPFRLLPDALAHPTNTMAAIMPERLANTPANTRLVEIAIARDPNAFVTVEEPKVLRGGTERIITIADVQVEHRRDALGIGLRFDPVEDVPEGAVGRL